MSDDVEREKFGRIMDGGVMWLKLFDADQRLSALALLIAWVAQDEGMRPDKALAIVADELADHTAPEH